MIVHVRLPRRPRPRDRKARLVLEWADVAFYIFGLVLTAALLALAAFASGTMLLHGSL